MPQFSYKSYCWAVGTTSFRTVDFNVQIERQLKLLTDFWSNPNFSNQEWHSNNTLQADYYEFMKENKFVSGSANRPDKDAREKTSSLHAIGLLDNERRLTQAGKTLLEISENANFNKNNLLQISNDSFIYLKQLLKTHIDVDGDIVRPFIVTLYALLELEYISNDEFTYLIPLV